MLLDVSNDFCVFGFFVCDLFLVCFVCIFSWFKLIIVVNFYIKFKINMRLICGVYLIVV